MNGLPEPALAGLVYKKGDLSPGVSGLLVGEDCRAAVRRWSRYARSAGRAGISRPSSPTWARPRGRSPTNFLILPFNRRRVFFFLLPAPAPVQCAGSVLFYEPARLRSGGQVGEPVPERIPPSDDLSMRRIRDGERREVARRAGPVP